LSQNGLSQTCDIIDLYLKFMFGFSFGELSNGLKV
jgi:hypothetical protein